MTYVTNRKLMTWKEEDSLSSRIPDKVEFLEEILADNNGNAGFFIRWRNDCKATR